MIVRGCYVESGTKYLIRAAENSNPFSKDPFAGLSAGDYVYLLTNDLSSHTMLYILSPGIDFGGGVWGIYAAADYEQDAYANTGAFGYWFNPPGGALPFSASYGTLAQFGAVGVAGISVPMYLVGGTAIGYNNDDNTFLGVFTAGVDAIGDVTIMETDTGEDFYEATWDTMQFVNLDVIEGATSGVTATVAYLNYVGSGGGTSIVGWYLTSPSGNFINGETVFKVADPAITSQISDWTGAALRRWSCIAGASLSVAAPAIKDKIISWAVTYETAYDDLPEHTNLILANVLPIVDFSGTPVSGNPSLKVSFSNLSTY